MTDDQNQLNRVETHLREDMQNIRDDIKHSEKMIRDDIKHSEKLMMDQIRDMGNKIDNMGNTIAKMIKDEINPLDKRLHGVEGETNKITGKFIGWGSAAVVLGVVIQTGIKVFS